MKTTFDNNRSFLILISIKYIPELVIILLIGTAQHGTLILTAFMAQFFSGTAISFYFIYFKNSEKAV